MKECCKNCLRLKRPRTLIPQNDYFCPQIDVRILTINLENRICDEYSKIEIPKEKETHNFREVK